MPNLKYILLLTFIYNTFLYSQNKNLDTLGKYTYEELEDKFYNYKDANSVLNKKNKKELK